MDLWETLTSVIDGALGGDRGHSGVGENEEDPLDSFYDEELQPVLLEKWENREPRVWYNTSATVSSSTGVLIVLVLSAAFAALFFAGYALLVGDDGTSGKRSYSQGYSWERPFRYPGLLMSALGQAFDRYFELEEQEEEETAERRRDRLRRKRRRRRRCLSLADEMAVGEEERRHLRKECRKAYE